MTIASLIDELIHELRQAGATSTFEDWRAYEPASAEDLDALREEVGCELTPDLVQWLEHVGRSLPLDGNYDTTPTKRIVDDLRSTREIDFSQHFANICSWNDGRFDDGRIARTYWQPQWVPIARDGCGNEYCVDLAPGPNGTKGQLIAMEFQDGQGPYLARWATLEAMLHAHLKKLRAGRYELYEGFLEYSYD